MATVQPVGGVVPTGSLSKLPLVICACSALPTADESDGDGKLTILLDGEYKVHANGKTYELSFTDYAVNTWHPDSVGLYALGVAPYNPHPGTKPTAASNALSAWANQYQIKNGEGTGIPSVYVYESPK